MIALSEPATRLLATLRKHAEGCTETRDGVEWRDVYLDNVRADVPDLTGRKFAWNLSALEHVGLYRRLDGFAFGSVVVKGGAL